MHTADRDKATQKTVASTLMEIALNNGLKPLLLAGRRLLPIVQGGMGVGVSAHRLAGSVTAAGGVGTIASVDLRHHHPDLLERTASLPVANDSKSISMPRILRRYRERFAWHASFRTVWACLQSM